MGAERLMLRLGSLCSGYGGLDLAAEHVFGPLEHTWHAEIDPHASKVLAHHWPTTPNLGDLTVIDWTRVPQVDVLTAGFPCQDVSCAGKRAGLVADRWDATNAAEMACGCFPMNHKVWCQEVSPLGSAPADGRTDEESLAAVAALNERDRADNPEWLVKGSRTGVWSYIADAIRELRPKIVLLENVRGLLSARADSDVEPCPWCVGDDRTEPVVRALGAVLADLAALGFDAEWVTVPASDVGAAHRRERVFIAAWPAADTESLGHGHSGPPRFGGISAAAVAGAAGAGAGGVTLLPTPAARDWRSGESNIMDRNARPLNEVIVNLLPTPKASDVKRNASAGEVARRSPALGAVSALLPTPTAKCAEDSQTHRSGARSNELLLTGVAKAHSAGALLLPTPMAADGGSDRASSAGFGLRDTSRKIPDQWGAYAPAIARWEAATGRTAPSPTEPGAKGQPRLAPPFVEWLMGLPAGWVTDHLGRGPALKCLGNGVVWQQAAHAYADLLGVDRRSEVAA